MGGCGKCDNCGSDNKKHYRVFYKSSDIVYLDVQADDRAEAIEIASESDGGEFTSMENKGEWVFRDVKEINGGEGWGEVDEVV